MKAIVHDRYGPPEVLEFRDVEVPVPSEGQVRIRVHAASVNPLDWHVMTGTPYLVRLMFGLRRPKQPILGADVAGVVDAVGPGVDHLSPGDRVFGGAKGSFAEFAIADAGRLAHIPDDISDTHAAATPVAGITALQALRDHANVTVGDRILVNGAAGGVGTFAVQIAAARGLDVTGVCSTRNVDTVAELGASRVIDYTSDDFVDGTRYDAIVDNVGNRTITDCRRSLTDDGTYVMVSGPMDSDWFDPFTRLVAGKVRFAPRSQTWANFTAEETAADLGELAELVSSGTVRPVIDCHFPLADTAEAVRYVMTGHARAKVIIDVRRPD